jgi:signal transduction histidine kinase
MSSVLRWRRSRQSVRSRLATRYAIVAFVTGALLLSFAYVVIRHELTPKATPRYLTTRGFAPTEDAAGTARPDAMFQMAPVSPLSGDALADVLSTPAATAEPLPGIAAMPAVELARTTATRDVAVRVLQAVSVRDQQVLRSVLLALGAALLLVTLISAWIGWLLAGRALAPVARITAAARGVTERNLHERIALGGPRDELRELADTFDGMLDKLDVAFESERRFVANASHELRTPLAVVRTAIDVAEDGGPLDEETRTMVGAIRRALTRAEQLVDRLLTLARSDRGIETAVPVPLGKIVAETVEERLGGGRAGDLAVTVEQRSVGDLTVSGDAVLLGTLVGNLLDNAVLYNRSGGRLWVTVGDDEEDDGWLQLRVENDGPLPPIEQPETLLRPFERAAGRTGHGGFGLGLSIVDSIARAHGGTVVLTARPEGGLHVEVRLPRAAG